MHCSLAWHGLPQPPQWALLVWRFVSQPLAELPSQLANPEVHWQAPLAQDALAPHALPHAPQWPALVWRFVSQPLAELPSQSARPPPH